MFSGLNRYWIVLFLMMIGYGFFEYYRPKPLDWRSTYSNKDKIPFGAKVLFELLPETLGDQPVEVVRVPPYNLLKGDSSVTLNKKESQGKSTYVFINSDLRLDLNDRKALINYVRKGNTVFISAYNYPVWLHRTLGIYSEEHTPTLKDTAKVVNFTNPILKDKKGFLFSRDDGRNYLRIRKNSRAAILAVNEDNEPVFVRVGVGKGQFYLHNLPLAFTNYYVLDSKTSKHAFNALSYLPKQKVYWDEYQKQGGLNADETSIFRYIVSQPALKSAYILTLIALILYAFFTGKRTQRIIPVVEPPKNVSLEFVKTIGNMYYRKRDHANMATKLVQHFWMYVRERFGLVQGSLTDEELIKIIGEKGGYQQSEMQFLETEVMKQDGSWTEKRLLNLNNALEDFYSRTR